MEELDEEGGSSSGYESEDDEGSREGGGAAAPGATARTQGDSGGGAGSSAAEGASGGHGGSGGDAEGAGGGAEAGGSPHNLREIADLDFETGKLSSTEREMLGSCQALMQAGTEVIKAYGRALLQGEWGEEQGWRVYGVMDACAIQRVFSGRSEQQSRSRPGKVDTGF